MNRLSAGMTLIELVAVTAILVILAGIAIVKVDELPDAAKTKCVNATLVNLRDAIVADYREDVRALPEALRDLFVRPAAPANPFMHEFDPATGTGWNGPYVQARTGSYQVEPDAGFSAQYGANDDPAILDPWDHPIVLQRPVVPGDPYSDATLDQFTRLVSAGPNGELELDPAAIAPNLLDPAATRDDIALYLFQPNNPVPPAPGS